MTTSKVELARCTQCGAILGESGLESMRCKECEPVDSIDPWDATDLTQQYDLPERLDHYENEALAKVVAAKFLMAKGGTLREIDANDAELVARVDALKEANDDRQAMLQRQADYLDTQLEPLLKFIDLGKKKSVKLLNAGTFGRRWVRDKVVVENPETAMVFCKEHLPQSVRTQTKVTHSLDKEVLKSAIEQGVPISDVHVIIGHDEFYARPETNHD